MEKEIAEMRKAISEIADELYKHRCESRSDGANAIKALMESIALAMQIPPVAPKA